MLFNKSKLKVQAQEIETSKKQIEQLRVQVNELNNSILYWTDQRDSYRGTRYTSYADQIDHANSMYNGTADWGVNQMGALVEARIGFIMPKGFKIIPKVKGTQKEQEFIDSFIQFNGLEKENIYHFLAEAELEGKVLFDLAYDAKAEYFRPGVNGPQMGMTSVRYISQVSNPYSITVNPNDYMMIEKAVYKRTSDSKEHTILEPNLVYRKFGGRLDNINETSSKVLKVLTQIENLDHALRDLREINHLFASPIPECETLTKEDAEANAKQFDKSNFKIGKMFFHTGKFGFAQPTMTGIEALYKEIVMLAEMISFNTGVPVHYWFPELATNRATAEDISWGLINSATSSDRNIWEGLLEEMINKAIAIYNGKSKMTPLRQGVFGVHIPVVTKDDWERMELWMRLRSEKIISLPTLLSKIPDDIDVDAEIKAVQIEKDLAFEQMKENGMFGAGNDNEDNQDTEDEDNE